MTIPAAVDVQCVCSISQICLTTRPFFFPRHLAGWCPVGHPLESAALSKLSVTANGNGTCVGRWAVGFSSGVVLW